MKNYLTSILLTAAASCLGQSSNITQLSPFGVSGNLSSTLPFLSPNTSAPSIRYQQVYASSDFIPLCGPVSCMTGVSPFLISDITFREAFGSTAGIDVNLANVQIDLSTSSKSPDGLTSNFAANIGTDDSVVFSGPLHFYETDGLKITLQKPFLYDPRRGNLLLDVRNFVTTGPPPFGFWGLQFESQVGDTVSSVSALNVNSDTATSTSTAGLITRFDGVAVPEPGPAVLFGLGMLGCGIIAFGRRRSAGRARSLAQK
jgi:hypothetical protein